MKVTGKMVEAFCESFRPDDDRWRHDWWNNVDTALEAALEAAPASAAEPVSKADVLQACLLLERACAYAGDAIPASILNDAQDLHARLSLTIETP